MADVVLNDKLTPGYTDFIYTMADTGKISKDNKVRIEKLRKEKEWSNKTC